MTEEPWGVPDAIQRTTEAITKATSLINDLNEMLTGAGLPPSEHGGIRGAVLLLIGHYRSEHDREAPPASELLDVYENG